MERAGRGVADGVGRLLGEHKRPGKNAVLVAGRGNNGGDAFVAARFLKEAGFNVCVLLVGSSKNLRGAARRHFETLKKGGITIREITIEGEWEQLSGEGQVDCRQYPTVVVDGVLGTGIAGAARGLAAAAIRYINQFSRKCLVVSIDIPSGLNSDSGLAEGEAVRADLTITMGLPKIGLIQQSALEYVGRLEVVDIGFPAELVAEIKSECGFIAKTDLPPLFPRRKRISNKGNYGHLLIIGGAAGYSGAMTLAAAAAARSGVGLVTVVVPQPLASVVAGRVPEAMVHAAPETDTGSLASSIWDSWKKKLDQFTTIVAGPGMTRHPETRRLVEAILRASEIPVVLDADALNVFEGDAKRLSERKNELVITPHPGEMARLLGLTVSEAQADRLAVVKRACLLADATVVLKGAGTLIAGRNKTPQINLTGNPGMAAGGMGDVLSGLLGGLLAQRLSAYDAARAAVWLHGRAGDLAAAQKTENALLARDLIAHLPQAFQELVER